MPDSEGGTVVPLTREIVLHLDPDDTPRTYEEAVDAVLADVRSTLIEKQRQRGWANVEAMGIAGLTLRMAEKNARECHAIGLDALAEYGNIWDAAANTPRPSESDRDDDCVDLIGLPVVREMVRRGWLGVPLAEAEEGEDDG